MAEHYDVIVKVGFTADQFLWMKDESIQSGLSQSAFIRSLVIKEIRSQSIVKLSSSERSSESPEVGLDGAGL